MKSNMIKCWFLLVLLMLAACQEKEELASTAKGSVSLKATIESDGTRTSVDEEGHVSWVETDAIGVFGEETRNAKFQSISSGSSVFFVGEMSSRQDIPTLAYYPYDENAVLDGNTLHFTLPSEYQYTGESNAPMLGIKQADGDFMFKHLCGLLKVTIKNMPENAKRLFVISEGTEEKAAPAITGDVLVNDVTANNATLSITENKGHEVSIDLKNTSAQETYTFYIPVPVGEYPKLSVKLEMNDGVIYMDKSVSNVKMVRAMMLDMPLIDLLEKKPDLGENMVLSDNTVLLTEDFTKYVSSIITDNVITLDASFPKNELPKVGEFLFYGDISEKFPYGFLGKVTEIKKDDKGYIVETTLNVGLDEAFDKLYIDQECTLQFADDEVATRSGLEDYLPNTFPLKNKVLPYWDDEGFSGFQYLNNLNLGSGVEFGLEGKTGRWSYGIKGTSDGELMQSSQSYFAIKLRPIISLETSIDEFHIHLIFDIKMGENMKSSSKGKFDASLFAQYEWPLKAIKLTPQGALLNVVLNPYFAIGTFYKLRSIESEYENIEDNYEKRYIASFEYSKGMEPIWSIVENKDFGNEEDYVESENSSLIIDKGSKTFGFSLALGLNFLKGVLNAEATADFGYERAMDYDLFFNKDESGKLSYEKMKEEIVSRNIYVNSDFSINKLTGIYSAGVHLTIPLLNIPLKDKYLVPDFKNLTHDNNGNAIEAMYSVSRELQWPVNISLGLIQDSEKIKESEMKEYKNESSTPIYAFKHTFTELSPFEDYIVQPVIYSKWGEIYATPIVEKKGICIVTKEYEFNPNDKTVTCYGQVRNLDDWTYLSEYGICYKLKSDDNENHVQSMRSLIDSDVYHVVLTDLSPGVYEYRAYIKIGDKYYYADETNSFEVKSESIVTIDATNITQTTATLSGIIQNYDTNNSQYGIIYSTDANPTASNGTIVYSNNIQEDGNYSVNVASLVKNTTYYYRAFVVNGGNYLYGEVMNFKTINEPSLRDLLIELYKTTNGDNWINNDNWCSDKPLTEWYGISVNTWSEKLHIDLSGNNLTGFVDFKAETTEESHIFSNVGRLYFNDNNLTSIDISGIRGVNVLNCAGNPLSSVLSVNCPDLSVFNCDERNYEQSSKVDKKIDLSNCSMLNSINCAGSNIVELKIDGCSSLQYLMCDENKLTSIDFTGCDAIYDINLRDNNLVSLDLGNKLGLKQLSVLNNKLTTINVIGCTSLEFIAASYNEFTSISLSGLSALTEAQFNYNLISDVSIENCVSLKCLLLDNNKLQKLDVSGMESLTGLFIRNNSISELNVDGCLNLEAIYANSNKLATLDLSGYAKLKTLYCHNNNMVSLNLDGCSALKSLHCVGNKLTEMNVEHCTQLEELECGNNKILKEITEFFMNLKYFKYDRRYYYIEQDDGSIKIEDRRVGWWYEGEPEKLEHKP